MGTLRVTALAGLASLVLAATASAESYLNSHFGWRIDAPPGWRVVQIDPAFVEFRPPAPRASAIIGVQSGSGPDEQLEIVATLTIGGWQRAISASGARAEIVERETIALSTGEPAVTVTATVDGARRGRTRILVTRIGERVVVVTAEGTRADWREHGAALDAAMQSFASASVTPE